MEGSGQDKHHMAPHEKQQNAGVRIPQPEEHQQELEKRPERLSKILRSKCGPAFKIESMFLMFKSHISTGITSVKSC